MILNLTSFPRSGNSFFTTQLLQFGDTWKKFDGTSVKFKPTGRIYNDSAYMGPRGLYNIQCYPWLDEATLDANPVDYIEDPTSVHFYKRHDLPDDYVGPRIYLVRDGRDVLYSFARHNLVHRKVVAGEQDIEVILLGDPDELNIEANRIAMDPNVQWGDCVERGMDHENTVTVVRYENMLQNAMLEIQHAMGKAGYIVSRVAEPLSFETLHEFAPHFFRSGKTGGYKKLDPDIVRAFEKRNEHTLKRLRYI